MPTAERIKAEASRCPSSDISSLHTQLRKSACEAVMLILLNLSPSLSFKYAMMKWEVSIKLYTEM